MLIDRLHFRHPFWERCSYPFLVVGGRRLCDCGAGFSVHYTRTALFFFAICTMEWELNDERRRILAYERPLNADFHDALCGDVNAFYGVYINHNERWSICERCLMRIHFSTLRFATNWIRLNKSEMNTNWCHLPWWWWSLMPTNRFGPMPSDFDPLTPLTAVIRIQSYSILFARSSNGITWRDYAVSQLNIKLSPSVNGCCSCWAQNTHTARYT